MTKAASEATVEGAVEQTLARNGAALGRIEERLQALIASIPANGGSLAVEMVTMDLLELRAILLGAEIDKRPEDPASVLGGLLRERFRVSTRAASSFFAETPEGWGRFSEFLREWVRRERERVPGPEGSDGYPWIEPAGGASETPADPCNGGNDRDR